MRIQSCTDFGDRGRWKVFVSRWGRIVVQSVKPLVRFGKEHDTSFLRDEECDTKYPWLIVLEPRPHEPETWSYDRMNRKHKRYDDHTAAIKTQQQREMRRQTSKYVHER
mmetsp:Transcript_21843/g.60830  ORF Transcript_21843/g.60830 Transcript_21843/m.60830 type:complete len:109 (-) Transcript_21843:1832-2158(-)